MRGSIRTLGRFLGGCLLFTVPLLATLEVATRVDQAVSAGAPLVGEYSHRSALETRDEFGVIGKPNGSYEKWHLNSYGFRGPEFEILPSPGKTRIVCIGASETFGLYETEGNEWPRQLERVLREGGRDFEVLNAALAAMTMRRRIDHFEQRVVPLRPDIAVIMLEYPSYVGVVQRRVASASPEPGAGREPGPSTREPQRAGVQLRTLRKFKDAVLPRLPPVVGRAWRGVSARLRTYRHRRNLGSRFQEARRVTPEQLAEYRSDLRRLLTVARDHEIQVLLLAPATRFDEETIPDFIANWPFIHPDWYREAAGTFRDAAGELAGSRTEAVLDLDPLMETDRVNLMPDPFHFTDAGAGLVAEAVAGRVSDAMRWGVVGASSKGRSNRLHSSSTPRVAAAPEPERAPVHRNQCPATGFGPLTVINRRNRFVYLKSRKTAGTARRERIRCWTCCGA